MNKKLEVFARNLKQLREDSGLSLRELAKRIGISKSMLQKYETMQSDPTLDKVKRIADFFGKSVNGLVGFNANDYHIEQISPESPATEPRREGKES